MKKNGFTLIELLIVVLIIGILASVAVPQYQKAVEKSRAAQALAVLKSLLAAEQRYYMANGQYASRFDDLDMELPWTGTEKWYNRARDTRSNGDWSLQIINDDGFLGGYMGRLTGKYKGGGFGIFANKPTGILFNTDEIVCLERVEAGVVLAGNAGDYCVKVMGGTVVSAHGGTRQYALP